MQENMCETLREMFIPLLEFTNCTDVALKLYVFMYVVFF